MKKSLFVLLLALATLPAFAQATLKPSATVPKVDGVISDKEYVWTEASKDITLGLVLSQDGGTLYAALSAPTRGWVAVGLGSLRMNNSYMVMGFDNGGSTISEQFGIRRNHAEANQKILKSSVAKVNGDATVLEFSVPAASFTKDGKLDLILAYGQQANFTSMHRWYTSLSVPIGK